MAIQNARTPTYAAQTVSGSGTASLFWKRKTSYFTRGFHNIMYRDHTIAAATKEKERRIVSLQRMREREEVKRRLVAERTRKRELAQYYWTSFGVGCGDKEIEALNDYQLEVFLMRNLIRNRRKYAAVKIQKVVRGFLTRK